MGVLFALSETQDGRADQIVLRTMYEKDWHLQLTPVLLDSVQNLIGHNVKVIGEPVPGDWYVQRLEVESVEEV